MEHKGHNTIIFYFKGNPFMLAKVSRNGSNNLKNEYKALKLIQTMNLNLKIMKTIEKPISLVTIDNKQILFKNYKRGVGSDKYISEGFFHKKVTRSTILLHEIMKWLMEWFEETREYQINSTKKKKMVLHSLIPNENSYRYLEYWLENEKFVLTPIHGDMVSSNIIINNKKINGIIDFESFKIRGLPQMDILDSILSIGYPLYNTDKKVIDNTFFNSNKFSLEVCNFLLKFGEFFELNPEDIFGLILIYSEVTINRCIKENEPELVRFYNKLKSEITRRKAELLFNN